MDKLYTIQEVASKLNLSDKTLRRWEEAGKFTPSRTLGNQRRYTLEDLQILDALKHGTILQQRDLLTLEQAAQLCGVSPATLGRWENEGKIHPFITSGNTYYPRLRLLEKLESLKQAPAQVDQVLLPPVPPLTPLPPSPSPSPIGPTSRPQLPLSPYLFQAILTLALLIFYHLIFNTNPSLPVSPQGLPAQAGVVQGVSTLADPRLEVLETKLRDHLQAEMLERAKGETPTIVQAGNSTLIAGTASLVKGQSQVSVTDEKITPSTLVTVSFNADYAPAKKYWVTVTTGSFTLHTDFPVAQDSSFNYILL